MDKCNHNGFEESIKYSMEVYKRDKAVCPGCGRVMSLEEYEKENK